ncbi:MAG: class II aldolase/adducin family protein [Micrococcales bacterium]|jgi:L-fuculose-phosphate aldolase|nr:class II aldolase/adducin family protein [Micrococcales bacterium]
MVSEFERNTSEIESDFIDELIQTGKKVVERGLAVGSGGNLSFRLPGTNTFFITGTGTQLDDLSFDSFAKMNLEGDHLSGVKPSSEFRVHLASYVVRPEVDVCIHLHPQASVLAAALDLDTKFLTIDHVYYLRKVTRIPWIRSGTQEIADACAKAAKDSNVIILENHGCVVLANSVSLAYSRVLNLEEASELTIRCKQLGLDPIEVPSAYWQFLRENNL